MELFLKRTFTTTLLLLLFTLHPVHLQNNTGTDVDPTDSPTGGSRKNVPLSWLRQKPKLPIILPKETDGTATDDSNDIKPMESEDPSTDDGNGLQPTENEDPSSDDGNGLQPLESEDPSTDDGNGFQPMENEDTSTDDGNGLQPMENEDTSTDTSGLQNQDGSSTDDQSGNGIASGSMFFGEPTEDSTQPSLFQNNTILASEDDDFNVSTTTQLPNGGASVTDADTPNNDTVLERVDEISQNSTSAINVTEVHTTTLAAETNATQPSDIGSGEGITENTMATTSAPLSKTTQQHSSMTSTVLQPTVPKETTTETPNTAETTTSVPTTTERANQSDKVAGPSGGTAERGFGSESERRQRKSAWGAVLGTFVAIAVVGLVAYVILKKKHHKAFSHRKLEEDFPSDPVLRLDNSEPLDLNFGRAAYYNPGLQGDNIQMSPYPKN